AQFLDYTHDLSGIGAEIKLASVLGLEKMDVRQFLNYLLGLKEPVVLINGKAENIFTADIIAGGIRRALVRAYGKRQAGWETQEWLKTLDSIAASSPLTDIRRGTSPRFLHSVRMRRGSSPLTENGPIASLIRLASQSATERERILDRLADIIERESAVLYGSVPDGLKPGEAEKYAAMSRAANVEQAAIQAVLGILGPDGLLDSERFLKLIDRSGMLERLGRWDSHVLTMKERAVNVAQEFKAKHPEAQIRKVKIFGLGGSAAPHNISAEIIANSGKSSIEIEVVRADSYNHDYIDAYTLVILSSFSGNTEETINCYYEIKHKTSQIVVIAKGGKLKEIARENGILLLQLPEEKTHPAFVVQPRESVCLQMTASLVFLASLGLAAGSKGRLDLEGLAIENEIIPLIKQWRQRFGPQVPFKDNPAKQLAFFLLYGIDYRGNGNLPAFDLWEKKVPFILADRNNWAIGHEPRTQMYERSKLTAFFFDAPEFLHNLVESIRVSVESNAAGIDSDKYVYYFIRSPDEEPRIRLRLDKTIDLVLKGKAKYAVLNVEGDNPYQRALFATCFNAHMTTYLAVLNGFDPLPVPTMSWIKNVMDGFPRRGAEELEAMASPRLLLEISSASSSPIDYSTAQKTVELLTQGKLSSQLRKQIQALSKERPKRGIMVERDRRNHVPGSFKWGQLEGVYYINEKGQRQTLQGYYQRITREETVEGFVERIAKAIPRQDLDSFLEKFPMAMETLMESKWVINLTQNQIFDIASSFVESLHPDPFEDLKREQNEQAKAQIYLKHKGEIAQLYARSGFAPAL
ncbi:MAG: SIS domain-containing protein, partial [Candidatus Omnitrophota bacterium]